MIDVGIFPALSLFVGGLIRVHIYVLVLGLQLMVPAVAIAFDLFVVIVTLMKCVRQYLEMRNVGQFSLTRLLLRDGK